MGPGGSPTAAAARDAGSGVGGGAPSAHAAAHCAGSAEGAAPATPLIPRFRLPSFLHVQLLQVLRVDREATGERVGSAQRASRQSERNSYRSGAQEGCRQAADGGQPHAHAGGGEGVASQLRKRP